MATQVTPEPGVKPVFIKARSVPDAENRTVSVVEMCVAAEATAGKGSIKGAQQIHGLWRIHPANSEARKDLLIKGLNLRQTVIQVADINPFIIKNKTGEEKETTKVTIQDVPISVADSEIEDSLIKAGCELRSAIIAERARDADGKLTRFITGGRFAFITIPATPLDKTMKVSFFTARVYHKEQKLFSKPPACSKCLQPGHWASQCEGDIVCRACKQPGHKKGDAACPLPASQDSRPSAEVPKSSSAQQGINNGPATAAGSTACNSQSPSAERGRTGLRQTTLFPRSTHHRNRSETPKRQRSSDPESPLDSRSRSKAKRSERAGESTGTASSDKDLSSSWHEEWQ